MNYGHALQFGALTDRTDLIEELGYDLAMVPEWTSLSFPGRSAPDRMHLAGGVLDVRRAERRGDQRSAASLDLLSGGPRSPSSVTHRARSPGWSEAVDVMRTIWDTSAPRADYRGSPPPAVRAETEARAGHAVPVWVAGDDPAVLEVAGQKADGWVAFFDPERAE